jgi:hypothetical protein
VDGKQKVYFIGRTRAGQKKTELIKRKVNQSKDKQTD